jgi:hypothetical protein
MIGSSGTGAASLRRVVKRHRICDSERELRRLGLSYERSHGTTGTVVNRVAGEHAAYKRFVGADHGSP